MKGGHRKMPLSLWLDAMALEATMNTMDTFQWTLDAGTNVVLFAGMGAS